MSQSSGRRPSRLRQVGIGLIVLVVILVVGDGVYLFLRLSSGNAKPVVPTYASATPQTPTPSADDLYRTATSKAPFLNDPLDGKQPADWGTFTSNQNGYAFRNGALHGFMAEVNPADLQAPAIALVECPLHNATFTDFAFQVQIAIVQGDQTFVGMFFRADQGVKHTYRFYIDFYGNYNFTTENNAEPVGTDLSIFQSGIQTQKTFTLTVIAEKTSFYLYLDRKYLRQVTDATYSSGGIGLFVTRGDAANEDVAFSQAEVWKL